MCEEWRLCLGPEWRLAQPLLRPTGVIGTTFPRCSILQSSRRAYRSPCRVIRTGSDRYVAVAPGEGDLIEVTAEQLAVHELDRERLAQRLSETLPFGEPAVTPVAGRDLYRIGTVAAAAGIRFPVFLAFPGDTHELQQSLATIVSGRQAPFLLLVPTMRAHSASIEQVLLDHRGLLVPLCYTVEVDSAGQWRVTDTGQANLQRFLAEHAPAARCKSPEQPFPTPADARWSDLRIRFVDGETVTVRVRDVCATLNYTQLGMADGRNGRPTRQWELLRIFAQEHGRLDWSSRQAGRRRQKQREVLARQLRTVFRIEGDPFCVDGNGWRTQFALVPDR